MATIITLVMSIPAVQTGLAKYAVKSLNENFNLNASIEKIRIGFPNRIFVTNAYVPDEHNDTLIFIGDLNVEVTGFNSKNTTLRTSKVNLNNGRLYMRKWEEDSVFNFQMFINRFQSGQKKKKKNVFKWKAKSVSISNFDYIKYRKNCADSCTQISLKNADIQVDDFFLNGNNVSGNIDSFKYHDEDRFDLHDMRAKVIYSDSLIQANGLYFKTDQSEFTADISLEYSDPSSFLDFVNEVNIVADIDHSKLSSNEFRDWLPTFPNFGNFSVSGKSKGPVNDLDCSNINVKLGSATAYSGDIKLTNTTVASKLYINTRVNRLRTNARDLEKYLYPLIDIEISEEVKRLGNISVKGNYKGGIEDLFVDGSLQSDIGYAYLKLHLLNLKDVENAKYDGDIRLNDFNIGELFELKGFENVTLNGNIDGTALTKEDITFDANLFIEKLKYKSYTYQNIKMNGKAGSSLFNGDLSVKDPNVDVSFKGTVDFKLDTALLDFSSKVNKVNLHAINLDKDTISIAAGEIDINVDFVDENWFDGYVNIFNSTYETSDLYYFFDSVQVVGQHLDNKTGIFIKSQLLNASLDGDYKLRDVVPSFKSVFSELYNFYDFEPENEIELDCKFDIAFNNTKLLSSVFFPEFTLSPGSHLKGNLIMPDNHLDFELKSSAVAYNDLHFRGINIALENTGNKDELSIKLGRFYNNSVRLDSSRISLFLQNDSLNYNVSTILKDSVDSYVKIKGSARETDSSEYLFHVKKSRFNLGYSDFELVGKNSILLAENRVEIEGVEISGESGNIRVNGVLSDRENEVLRISTDSANLKMANYIIGNKNLDLSGYINGDVIINSAYHEPKIISNVKVDSLAINDAWVGDLKIDTDWDVDRNLFDFKSNIYRGELHSLELNGKLYPDSNYYVDANLNLNRFRADAFNAFLTNVLDNINGSLIGDVAIRGPISKPSIDGVVELNKVGLSVPYLNAQFNIEGKPKIVISDTLFSLEKSNIRDSKNGTKGVLYGTVSHHVFKDIVFDLNLKADKLYAMNLTKEQNSFFYGQGYASGDMSIIGPINDLVLELNLVSEKGTDFKIAVSGPKEIEVNSFITFQGSHAEFKDVLKDVVQDLELRGLTLKLNVKITPEANIELIMDETVGDIIKTTGKGNLRMMLLPSGEFTIFGDYEIVKGDYLFTMRNLVNKPFELKSGGTISWQGDPYEATLDLNAVYTTRTSLTDVVTSPDYKDQKVKVALYLQLKGLLSNPSISFKIDLPGSSTSWQEELNNRFTNVDKLNEQAFSLLMLNSFWVDGGTSNSALQQGISSNTYQMLFSQMSNWISAGTDFIDVNMSYSQSTNEQTTDEFELELSKTFYDDRITVSGIFDVPVNSSGAQVDGQSQSFTGDLEVLYKITKDGRIQAKFFNRSNQNNPTRSYLSDYTQGIGILYRKDFDSWSSFFKSFFSTKSKAKKEDEIEEEDKSTELQ